MPEETLDPSIHWAAADRIKLMQLNGQIVSLSSICKSKKTVFVFVRKFYCPVCHSYLLLFSKLKRLLEEAQYQIVFISCHESIYEATQFIQNFSVWLKQVSDGNGPAPGQFYIDPARQSFKFFGFQNDLSKFEVVYQVARVRFAKMIAKFWRSNHSSIPKTKSRLFFKLIKGISSLVPRHLMKHDMGADSVVWQSPGICVLRDDKVTFKVSSTLQSAHIRSTF